MSPYALAPPDEGPEQVGAGSIPADAEKQGTAGPARVPEELGGLGIGRARLHLGDLVFQVAVGCEQIEAAVEVVVEKEEAEGQGGCVGAPRP